MKTKYATLIRSLLQNYHAQAKAIDKETFSVHSDGLQLMELNIQLAKCLEGITSTARFNNDSDDFEELHKSRLWSLVEIYQMKTIFRAYVAGDFRIEK